MLGSLNVDEKRRKLGLEFGRTELLVGAGRNIVNGYCRHPIVFLYPKAQGTKC